MNTTSISHGEGPSHNTGSTHLFDWEQDLSFDAFFALTHFPFLDPFWARLVPGPKGRGPVSKGL